MYRWFGLTVLSCIAGVVAAEDKAPEVITFRTQARVEVDAEGKVTDVQPHSNLPPAVAREVETTVGRWRFDTPQLNGRPVSGVTFVKLGGCAAPQGEGFVLAFEYQGNGPGSENGVMAPPAYPPNAARAGVGAKVKVTYRVEGDGTAVVEKIESDARGGYRKQFHEVVKNWITNNKYKAEWLDGRPIATRMEVPVDFVAPVTVSAKIAEKDRQQMKDQELQQPSCQAVFKRRPDPNQAMALDTPFRLLSQEGS